MKKNKIDKTRIPNPVLIILIKLELSIIRTGLGILVLSILFFFIHKFSGYEVLQTG